jgi:hypothetical protein
MGDLLEEIHFYQVQNSELRSMPYVEETRLHNPNNLGETKNAATDHHSRRKWSRKTAPSRKGRKAAEKAT